jgi:hypothetical protein
VIFTGWNQLGLGCGSGTHGKIILIANNVLYDRLRVAGTGGTVKTVFHRFVFSG